jgi:curli biogenesis system outer membrane secretion channel CsgG
MLTLILALALAAPPPATAPSESAAAPEAAPIQTAVQTAKTPASPRIICKWRAHSTGIPIRYCGTARAWRDEKINHQQDIEVGQRRLLVAGPY